MVPQGHCRHRDSGKAGYSVVHHGNLLLRNITSLLSLYIFQGIFFVRVSIFLLSLSGGTRCLACLVLADEWTIAEFGCSISQLTLYIASYLFKTKTENSGCSLASLSVTRWTGRKGRVVDDGRSVFRSLWTTSVTLGTAGELEFQSPSHILQEI